MTLEETLKELKTGRLAYRARRALIDEEVRQLRASKLAAAQEAIEHIVVKAVAEGATLGQIKKAYGTKDHRTISDIVTNRSAEIEAIREARAAESRAQKDWFDLGEDAVRVTLDGHEASFGWAIVDDEVMFITDTPAWNDDFTIKNEAVALLDGKTESTSEEARQIGELIRKQG